MSGNIVKSTMLHNNTGSSDKVYNVYLEQLADGSYDLYGESGPRGGRLVRQGKAIGGKGAFSEFDKLVSSKLKKGYQVVGSNSTPRTSAAPTANEAATKLEFGLQYVNSITEEEALQLIESPFWLMQQKIDGERRPVSLKLQSGKILATAGNKKGDLVQLSNSIIDGLQTISNFYDCDFDAEAVGDDLYIFDVLKHKAEDMKSFQAGTRLELLEEIDSITSQRAANIHFVKTYWTAAEKRQAFTDIQAKGLEGVVFKLRASVYEAGKPNSGGPALKYRFLESTTVQVTDVGASRSVGVSMRRGEGDKPDELVSVGRVTVSSNFEMPKLGDLIQVRYMYITNKGGSLIQPVMRDYRTDKVEPNSLTELKIKPDVQKLAA